MKKVIIIIILLAAIVGGFFYFRYQVYYSHGSLQGEKTFEIKKGEGNGQIAANLKNEGLISGKIYFYYYLRMHNLINKILPGKYDLNGKMTIPEIAVYITNEENILPGYAKITFPEGWTSDKMADRLTANGFDGDSFLKLVKNPPAEMKNKYLYPYDKNIATLEGYLFPDTYFLKKDLTPENIVGKALDNFNSKVDSKLKDEIKNQNKTLNEIITMASILEKEVQTGEDMKIVSGILWNRLKTGQALQCDSTLAYVLGVNKKQYSFEESRTASPYNTYINKGLPPGPISNPGITAIDAAIHPTDTNYNYFLSDPATGKTIYAATFEEHIANKNKIGL